METSTGHVWRVIILGFIVIFMAATAGCAQAENKPAPEQGNEDQNKPIPGELIKFQSNLDQLYIMQFMCRKISDLLKVCVARPSS